MKRKWLPQAIASGMLLWALYPGNPSGYYTLLHWFCCGTLIYQACRAVSLKRHPLVWILGITAWFTTQYLDYTSTGSYGLPLI